MEAKQTENKPDNKTNEESVIALTGNKITANLTRKGNITSLGNIENKAVTLRKEPSYTSHNHIWKGKEPSLKRIDITNRVVAEKASIPLAENESSSMV